jgi:hypothetical protein
MDKPRELLEIQWPESQRIMEHPEAALVLGAVETSTYMIPKDVWEQYKDSYYVKMWYQVQIDCSKDEDWEKAKKLRSTLTGKGITFDSGVGMQTRMYDWSLDWSLTGALPVTVLNQLELSGLDYTFTEHEPKEDE